MSPRLFVGTAFQLFAEEPFEHSPGVGVTWEDAIRCEMTGGIVDLLSDRYQNLTTKESDSLVLLLRLGGVEARTHFLELAIYLLPPSGFFEDLSALAKLLRREDGPTRNLFRLDERPAVGCELAVIGGNKIARLIRIWSHDGVSGFTEEPQKLIIRCAKKAEAFVVEDPVVRPVWPVDPVLVDVPRRVAHSSVRRRHGGKVIEAGEEIVFR
jgi:hypothetical protein